MENVRKYLHTLHSQNILTNGRYSELIIVKIITAGLAPNKIKVCDTKTFCKPDFVIGVRTSTSTIVDYDIVPPVKVRTVRTYSFIPSRAFFLQQCYHHHFLFIFRISQSLYLLSSIYFNVVNTHIYIYNESLFVSYVMSIEEQYTRS